MFDIEYRGGNSVVITTKKTTLVADPDRSVIGQKKLATKESVVVATEARFAVNDESSRISIEGPGEYEVGDFSIRGIAAQRHIDEPSSSPVGTGYRIEVQGIRVGLIGNIAPKLSETQLEELGILDIVIVPVGGGGYTLDATSAATLIRQIGPKVVIPVHYSDSELAYEVPQDTLETFTKELGAPVETVPKYKVKSTASLPAVLSVVEITRS